jgi:hypothetical protein
MRDNDLQELLMEIRALHSQMLTVQADVQLAARRQCSLLVHGFMVTITLLLAFIGSWLAWIGALAPIFPKP